MKIAIFHNFLDNIGGAEIVDLMLAEKLDADIYTTNIDKEKISKMGFQHLLPKIHSIGKVPINAPLKQELSYWKFRKLNLKDKYDFYIIAGDWAMSGAIKNKPHLWYVYSPTREIWDLFNYTRKNSVKPLLQPIFILWVFLRRILNKHDSKKVQKIISISKNVQKRIKKYLNRDSKVIYPPINTKKYSHKKSKGYWLSVNRLITHKRVHLQIEAFKNLPNEKLIIIGSYEQSRHFKKYAKYILENKPKNVEIKSWVSEKELLKLYSECKGFITTSKDEDFGLTPLEALASGKPVIAPKEGGYKETLNNKTGILIKNINSKKLIEAIKKLNFELKKSPNKYKKDCIAQAEKFNLERFVKEIKEEIKNGN